MPRKSFRLNIALIDHLLVAKEWTRQDLAVTKPDEFHPSLLSRALDDKIAFTNRKGVGLDTLLKIAAKLGYQGKHLELTLCDDGTPYLPVRQETDLLPEALIDQDLFGLTIKGAPRELIIVINASEAIITLLTSVQWNELITRLISSAATAILKKIAKGSIVLTIKADEIATKDLVDSFLAWRLQHLGVNDMCVVIPRTLNKDFVDATLSHFHFAEPQMRERCGTSFLLDLPTTISTYSGLHIIQLNPPDRIRTGLDHLVAVKNAVHAAWRATEDADEHMIPAPWQLAAKAWRVAVDTSQSLRDDLLEVHAHVARDIIDHVVIAANSASKVVLNPSSLSMDGSRTAYQAANAALRVIESAYEIVNAPWDTASHEHTCWLFRSTLLPTHVHTASTFWRQLNAFPPQQARFPENEPTKPQLAVLFDDETFLNQPQYQPS